MKYLIIDYGAGNTTSLKNALDKLGIVSIISNKPKDIKNAQSYLFAGVGSAKNAINKLKEYKIYNLLQEEVLINRKNFLGICIGAQILFNSLEEDGGTKGFGWINGTVSKINSKKLPHVGWNKLKKTEKEVYFDHSFKINCSDIYINDTIMYDNIEIPAIIQKENIIGIQFHPEKSGIVGLEILKNNLFKEVKCLQKESLVS
jgi:glutamine amidotransferase